MAQKDFKIINDNGKVSIVRYKTANGSKVTQTGQSMRVMCFDSDQIDRIFSIQEHSVRSMKMMVESRYLKRHQLDIGVSTK